VNRRFVFVLTSVLLLLVPNVPMISAQSDDPIPLTVTISGQHGEGDGDRLGGDLWTWLDDHLVPNTTWSFNYPPSVSPDGQKLAYLSLPRTFVTAHDLVRNPQNVAGWDNLFPANIWISSSAHPDGSDKLALRIADQSKVSIYRSNPAWSPDSKQLVWTEIAEDNPSVTQLVVYDVASQRSQSTAIQLPPDPPIPSLGSLSWTDLGIAITVRDQMYFFGTDGKWIRKVSISQRPLEWVTQNNTSVLIEMDWSGGTLRQWLVDPMTGGRTPFTGRVEYYSLLNPDGLSVVEMQDKLVVQQGQQVVATIPWSPLDSFVISPDGKTVVYTILLSEGPRQVSLYRVGTSDPLTPQPRPIVGLSWGPVGARVVAAN
jgi:WD40-like Beta Propeller Repeat